MIDQDTFREAMARYPGAVTAIATTENGMPSGLIATSVCSLSADPPSIVACINRSASAHDIILRQGFFGVSLLSDSQSHIVERLTRKSRHDRFSPEDWMTSASGSPVVKDAVAAFDCRLVVSHDAYSHTILIGQIDAVVMPNQTHDNCLIWHRRAFAQLVQYPSP